MRIVCSHETPTSIFMHLVMVARCYIPAYCGESPQSNADWSRSQNSGLFAKGIVRNMFRPSPSTTSNGVATTGQRSHSPRIQNPAKAPVNRSLVRIPSTYVGYGLHMSAREHAQLEGKYLPPSQPTLWYGSRSAGYSYVF